MSSEAYNGVTLAYQPKILRVNNDEALAAFLARPENGSMALAAHMQERYQRLFATPLAIQQESIAIEILGHVFADNVAATVEHLSEKLSLLGPLAQAMEKIRRRTEVIDIGEKNVDDNRWLWDALIPFRSLIFKCCGKDA